MQPPARQKEHLLYAAVIKYERQRDFRFCKYTNAVYYENMKSQKSFSQFHLAAPLLFNSLLLSVLSANTSQVRISTELT